MPWTLIPCHAWSAGSISSALHLMTSVSLTGGHSIKGMYCVVRRRYNNVCSAQVSVHANICLIHHGFACLDNSWHVLDGQL